MCLFSAFRKNSVPDCLFCFTDRWSGNDWQLGSEAFQTFMTHCLFSLLFPSPSPFLFSVTIPCSACLHFCLPLRDGVSTGPSAAHDCCSTHQWSKFGRVRDSPNRLRLGPRASLHPPLWPGHHLGCSRRMCGCWWDVGCHSTCPSLAVSFTARQRRREVQWRGTHPPAAPGHHRLVRPQLCLPDWAGRVSLPDPQGLVGPPFCRLLLLLAGSGRPPAQAGPGASKPQWLRAHRPGAGFERCAGHHRSRVATSDRVEGGESCLSVPAFGLLISLQLCGGLATSRNDCCFFGPVWEDTSVALQRSLAAGDLPAVSTAVGGLDGLLSVRQRLAWQVSWVEWSSSGNSFGGSGLAADDLSCHSWIPHLLETPTTTNRSRLLRHVPELNTDERDKLWRRHPSFSQAVCGEPGLWLQRWEHRRYCKILKRTNFFFFF